MNIEVKVTLYSKNYLGVYDKNTKYFVFDNIPSLEKKIALRDMHDDGSITISYMFSCDYLPRYFHITKEEPQYIEDFITFEGKEVHVQIVISIK